MGPLPRQCGVRPRKCRLNEEDVRILNERHDGGTIGRRVGDIGNIGNFLAGNGNVRSFVANSHLGNRALLALRPNQFSPVSDEDELASLTFVAKRLTLNAQRKLSATAG
jgi:hypothetical protein